MTVSLPDRHRLYERRRAGVLLHPTSLPGTYPAGQICHEAYRFVEFLAQAGFSVWQMLPLGPTHTDRSPYAALSVHAGEPRLISLDWLRDRDLLDPGKPGTLADDSAWLEHAAQLQVALDRLKQLTSHHLHDEFRAFNSQQAEWLDDFSLFMALREEQDKLPWTQWPAALRDRRAAALREARARLATQIEYQQFCQFVFYRQWQGLKQYANRHGVLLFGDLPLYVALDSADVWAQRKLFAVDPAGSPTHVAGVPPDYFSATGQRWGNPQYRWKNMRADDFAWWRLRMKNQLQQFDLLRIDHFRGLQAYWDIPAAAATALEGRWVKAPGKQLLQSLRAQFQPLPLVAEDLGYITPEVHELRQAFDLPGMRILQFAFDGTPHNPYLPHAHEFESVVYTGTHDNDTTLGWYQALDDAAHRHLLAYLGYPADAMPWPLIRSALASVCCLAMLPMQDLLGLGAEGRMNTPGISEGNWRWRFDWEQLPPGLMPQLRAMLQLYDRR